MRTNSRRSFLRSVGAAGAVGTAALAGCVGVDDGADEDLGEPVPEIQFVFQTAGASPDRNELGNLIADNFEAVGFEVDRQEREFDPAVQQTVVEQDFDVSLLGWGGTPERIDPHIFLTDMHHSDYTEEGGRNTPGYENPDYDELAEAQAREVDEDARRELVFEAQAMLSEDQPRCYIANEGGDHPYNAERLDSVNPTLGEGLNGFWNFMELEPADGVNEVSFGYGADIISLNPMQDMATPDRQFIRLIYDQLYRFGEDGDPVPWLAVDEPEISDDGTMFTVEIREGHTFHDGEDVTVDDVAFSFDLFYEHSPTYQAYLDGIEEIETSGNEITFHLEEPDATFISNALAQIYVFPEHIWSEIHDPTEQGDDDYIGSGPFEFEDWEREVELQLGRFDDHFQPPNVSRLIRIPGDAGTLVDQIEAHEIDMFGNEPTPTQAERIADDPDLGLATFQDVGHVKLAYNMRRDHMDDPHLRRAMSYCVPKETFVEDIRGGMGTVTHSPISEAVENWHNPDVEQYTEDLEAAEEELEAGGYERGSDGKLYYAE
ncbi:ABC transporter substrate-binding protein [Natrarchaeobaculum sulfurireducens]|uniref:ABC-type transport system, periplasmic component n=1 Tax=Natrarchaeobaculum sulfurireducens TaxID=2044521 RepID=A0A346PI15_9EURY|nr:ABC transporter substrate-binding protein [Natrarchaeobaculum sulfurireducens]AXR79160.1 ABC-type transport system, periplasmic component [Natrarchaeobaculum sulfurireducens]